MRQSCGAEGYEVKNHSTGNLGSDSLTSVACNIMTSVNPKSVTSDLRQPAVTSLLWRISISWLARILSSWSGASSGLINTVLDYWHGRAGSEWEQCRPWKSREVDMVSTISRRGKFVQDGFTGRSLWDLSEVLKLHPNASTNLHSYWKLIILWKNVMKMI